MAELKFSGVVKKVYPLQTVNDKLRKRQLVIEDDAKPQWPQFGVFMFINDKTSLLDNLKQGDRVTVDFNVTGRSYSKPGEELKYFTELQGWKLNIDTPAPRNQGMGAMTNAPTVEDSDSLPF